MYLDELMRQKHCVDKMIEEIATKYPYESEYRIERKMECDVTGVCGLYDDSYEKKNQIGAVKSMRMLFFLLYEKKRMAEAVSKCQRENNKEIVKIYEHEIMDANKEYVGRISGLYQKLSDRKKIQKTKGGYDMIVTWTNKIDRTLLDALYRKYSQVYQNLQTEKEECGKIKIEYEPAIDYTQYEYLGLDACYCELEKKGVITNGEEK